MKFFIITLSTLVFSISAFAGATKRNPATSDKCSSAAIDAAVKQYTKDYNYPHKKPVVTGPQDPGEYTVVLPQGKNSDIGDVTYDVQVNGSCTSGTATLRE